MAGRPALAALPLRGRLTTTAPRVAVSVLHWGDPADTLRCLASVAASAPAPALVAVLDNGTGTLDAGALAHVAPVATLVRVPENLGFAGGHDLLLARALEAGATHVLLLNNDATVAPDAIAALVRAATAEPRVGAVGAKVLSAADPTRLWLAWGRVTWRAALVERVGRGQPDGPAFDDVRAVEWVPGCAMLLTREAIATVGALDEAFFAYHEDVDWCVRARAAGFRILFAPAARVVHRGEGGRGLANPARYLSARNTMLFARKHAGAREWLRLGVTIGASLARETVRGDRAVTALLWRGYRDGLFGRPLPLRELGLR
ncbi:MAG: glycosyltransferase family 2 protein [bacterium]|nr:glycosyltransferase family 2 protein [bacterium]